MGDATEAALVVRCLKSHPSLAKANATALPMPDTVEKATNKRSVRIAFFYWKTHFVNSPDAAPVITAVWFANFNHEDDMEAI